VAGEKTITLPWKVITALRLRRTTADTSLRAAVSVRIRIHLGMVSFASGFRRPSLSTWRISESMKPGAR